MPRYFYPRPPRGGRQLQRVGNVLCGHISIHALREEGDGEVCQHGGRKHPISIHALREEGDPGQTISECVTSQISIHALREEGDHDNSIGGSVQISFLSTPSARRATSIPCRPMLHQQFLSTPSARRATWYFFVVVCIVPISIHALREEGDAYHLCTQILLPYFYPRPPRGGRLRKTGHHHQRVQFLSTPSARRATKLDEIYHALHDISIHALREEGDPQTSESME